jgi:hypothetical protein
VKSEKICIFAQKKEDYGGEVRIYIRGKEENGGTDGGDPD